MEVRRAFGITLENKRVNSSTRAATVVKASIKNVIMKNTSVPMKEGATSASGVAKFSELIPC